MEVRRRKNKSAASFEKYFLTVISSESEKFYRISFSRSLLSHFLIFSPSKYAIIRIKKGILLLYK